MPLRLDITKSTNNKYDINLISTWKFTVHKAHHMYVCTCVCISLYVCMCVCVYVCLCMCVCVHIYIFTHLILIKTIKALEILFFIPFHTDNKGLKEIK